MLMTGDGMETKEGVGGLVKAGETALGDIEFLDEYENRARQDLDKGKSEQEGREARIAAKRR